MSRDLTAGMIAAVQDGTVRPVLIAEIDTAGGTVRVWNGIGDLAWDSQTWTGVGDLGGASPVKETADIEATNCRFTLSGIASAMISIALGQVRWGRTAKLWLGLLDADGDLIADPYLLFSGFTDVPAIDEGAETATITVTAESRLVDLDRPRVRRYTPEDQAIDFPADKGFEFVAALQDAEIVWGR